MLSPALSTVLTSNIAERLAMVRGQLCTFAQYYLNMDLGTFAMNNFDNYLAPELVFYEEKLDKKRAEKSGYETAIGYRLEWSYNSVAFQINLRPWAKRAEIQYAVSLMPGSLDTGEADAVKQLSAFLQHFHYYHNKNLFYEHFKNKLGTVERTGYDDEGLNSAKAKVLTFIPSYKINLSYAEFFAACDAPNPTPAFEKMRDAQRFACVLAGMMSLARISYLAGNHAEILPKVLGTSPAVIRVMERTDSTRRGSHSLTGALPDHVTYVQRYTKLLDTDGEILCPMQPVWFDLTTCEWKPIDVVLHDGVTQPLKGCDNVCDNCAYLLKCAARDFQNPPTYAKLLLPEQTSVAPA